jgi:MYXO-CTERM domain-containing protein
MLRNTLIASATVAVAAAANAGLATWTVSGTGSGTGSLASLGTVNILLTMSIDSSASALSGVTAISGWTFQMTNSASTELFNATGLPGSGVAQNTATFVRWTAGGTNTRRYTVGLGGTTSSSWTSAAPALPSINLLELGYVANRTGGIYGNFGNSLLGSASGNGGFVMAAATGGGSFGAVSLTNFVVTPTPGAAGLAIVAGLASFRRRRASFS